MFPFFLKFTTMLKYIDQKNVSGYCYKNITIPMENNRTTYNIATQFNLGLPPTSIMCGVVYRFSKCEDGPRPRNNSETRDVLSPIDVTPVQPFAPSNCPKSINNREIIPEFFLTQGFITIRDIETYDVISNQSLSNYVDYFTGGGDGSLNQSVGVIWHEPRRIGEIDWQRSIIYFPEWLIFGQFVDKYDIEIQIIYYNPTEASEIAPQLTDRIGFAQEGIRSKQIEIVENGQSQYYSFAKNSTIGIDPEALITGIGLSYYNKVSYSSATKGIAKDSSFITIKDRYRTIVNNFPVVIGQSLNTISMQKNFAKYLPIQPTRVCDFDWEGSQLFISDKDMLTEDASNIFQIFYVQPIYK
jgi:hypothetical protein